MISDAISQIFKPLFELAKEYGVEVSPISSTTVVIAVPGKWEPITIAFHWNEDIQCLGLMTQSAHPIPKVQGNIYKFLHDLNRGTAFGHFEFADDDTFITYRLSHIMNGPKELPSSSLYLDLINDCIYQCDRLGMAMALMQNTHKVPTELDHLAMFETHGKA